MMMMMMMMMMIKFLNKCLKLKLPEAGGDELSMGRCVLLQMYSCVDMMLMLFNSQVV